MSPLRIKMEGERPWERIPDRPRVALLSERRVCRAERPRPCGARLGREQSVMEEKPTWEMKETMELREASLLFFDCWVSSWMLFFFSLFNESDMKLREYQEREKLKMHGRGNKIESTVPAMISG